MQKKELLFYYGSHEIYLSVSYTHLDVYKRQAQYMGNADSNTNVEQKTKSLEKNINASLVYKGDSLNGSFGFNGKDGTFDSTVYKRHTHLASPVDIKAFKTFTPMESQPTNPIL